MKSSLSFGPLLKRFSYGTRIHPARDWFYVLLAASLFIALSIAWNIWLLRSVEAGGTIGDESVEVESFDESGVESVRALFKERETEQLRYRQEYRFVDPSL